MALKWSEEINLKLVDLYEQHPVLWNAYDKFYTNGAARQSALEDIARKMDIDGLTAEAITNRIRSLSAYNDELEKSQRSSGAGANETNNPKRESLLVTKNVTGNGIGYSLCIDLEEEDDDDVEVLEVPAATRSYAEDVRVSLKRKESPPKPCPDRVPVLAATPSCAQDERVSSKRKEPPPKPCPDRVPVPAATPSCAQDERVSSKRKEPPPEPCSDKKRLDFDRIHKTVEELKALSESLNKTEPLQNEGDIFGNLILHQLKQLTPPSWIYAQEEIQKVLTRYRINDLQKAKSSIKVRDISSLQ